jgi:hypothetical protein
MRIVVRMMTHHRAGERWRKSEHRRAGIHGAIGTGRVHGLLLG